MTIIIVSGAVLILGAFAIFAFLEVRDKKRAERGVPKVHDRWPW